MKSKRQQEILRIIGEKVVVFCLGMMIKKIEKFFN